MDNIQLGDRVRITWTDGEQEECVFVRFENGFYVFKSNAGAQVVCRLQHVKLKKLNEENK